MSDANNEQLRPPPSWDKFEEICADLFSRIWKDNQLVRYGRAGQRQHGVDIYGKDSGADAAVQCKGKRDWPPTKLTIPEIDAEFKEVKKFNPPLSTYILATTADNDVYITDHVNAVSAKHAERGLFRVTVFGWKELTRRLYDYPELLDKHFNTYTLRQMKRELPGEIVTRVVEGLLSTNLVAGPSPAHVPTGQSGPLDDRMTEALERDYATRYKRLLQRSVFPELHKRDEFAPLASELLETKGAPSSHLRRKILLRASRSASIHGNLDDGRRFLAEGQKLSGSEPDELARARLAVAEGRVDEAIQLLRDRTDPDSRTVLFTILANERGYEIATDWLVENNLSPTLLTPNGVLSLCFVHLRRNDLASVNRIISQATSQQFVQLPYLYFLRGAMSFASVLPVPEQASALSGFPSRAASARTIARCRAHRWRRKSKCTRQKRSSKSSSLRLFSISAALFSKCSISPAGSMSSSLKSRNRGRSFQRIDNMSVARLIQAAQASWDLIGREFRSSLNLRSRSAVASLMSLVAVAYSPISVCSAARRNFQVGSSDVMLTNRF